MAGWTPPSSDKVTWTPPSSDQVSSAQPQQTYTTEELINQIPGAQAPVQTQATPQQEAPWYRRAINAAAGLVEPAVSAATGAIAGPIGAAYGVGYGLTHGYGTQAGANEAERRGAALAQSMTYQPVTQTGRALTSSLGSAMDQSGIAGLGPDMGLLSQATEGARLAAPGVRAFAQQGAARAGQAIAEEGKLVAPYVPSVIKAPVAAVGGKLNQLSEKYGLSVAPAQRLTREQLTGVRSAIPGQQAVPEATPAPDLGPAPQEPVYPARPETPTPPMRPQTPEAPPPVPTPEAAPPKPQMPGAVPMPETPTPPPRPQAPEPPPQVPSMKAPLSRYKPQMPQDAAFVNKGLPGVSYDRPAPIVSINKEIESVLSKSAEPVEAAREAAGKQINAAIKAAPKGKASGQLATDIETLKDKFLVEAKNAGTSDLRAGYESIANNLKNIAADSTDPIKSLVELRRSASSKAKFGEPITGFQQIGASNAASVAKDLNTLLDTHLKGYANLRKSYADILDEQAPFRTRLLKSLGAEETTGGDLTSKILQSPQNLEVAIKAAGKNVGALDTAVAKRVVNDMNGMSLKAAQDYLREKGAILYDGQAGKKLLPKAYDTAVTIVNRKAARAFRIAARDQIQSSLETKYRANQDAIQQRQRVLDQQASAYAEQMRQYHQEIAQQGSAYQFQMAQRDAQIRQLEREYDAAVKERDQIIQQQSKAYDARVAERQRVLDQQAKAYESQMDEYQKLKDEQAEGYKYQLKQWEAEVKRLQDDYKGAVKAREDMLKAWNENNTAMVSEVQEGNKKAAALMNDYTALQKTSNLTTANVRSFVKKLRNNFPDKFSDADYNAVLDQLQQADAMLEKSAQNRKLAKAVAYVLGTTFGASFGGYLLSRESIDYYSGK